MASDSVFRLPERLAAKGAHALIAADEDHFARIGRSLAASVTAVEQSLAAARRGDAGEGQAALDRDLEVHRLTARLHALRRYRLDLCLGRFVRDDGEMVYVGRFGLTDDDGERLLVDWRAPAAEPFFAATRAEPRGITARRRYRWVDGSIADYWDEVFADVDVAHAAALDDQSAFIASLGASRSAHMRDVLGTIQADQDAILRADSRGALVVDGGPGTGKTVVALHRAAYLLYADPRLAPGRGGVLVVGPHRPFLDYVADVLPSLGEDSVQTCTVHDLVPEGADASREPDARVAALKATIEMVAAIEPAVRLFEEPPTVDLVVSTPWADARLTAADWADAFSAAEPGATHNEARDQVWAELLDILIAQHDPDEAPPHLLRRSLVRDGELARVFTRAWPILDPAQVIADLWSVPAYLRRSAPHLSADDVAALQRTDPRAWSDADLPLLDAARQRIGDPDASRCPRQHDAERARERERRARVIDDLIAADDSEMRVMSMLRQDDAQNSLDDVETVDAADPLAGSFAHIVVDEAQELTDAEWGMLLRRCPSRSFTVVGDRAQARRGFAGTWEERLRRAGLRDIRVAGLTINYRTPIEVMAEAEPVIRAAIPDANVPTAVRESGLPVCHAPVDQLDETLAQWLAREDAGTVCVIGHGLAAHPHPRVRVLTPETAKGLEFDLVVLVEPETFGDGVAGAVDRYVAMSRATQQLVVLT